MLNYLIENKEWLFSGIGVAAISWFFLKFKSSASMKQKSGNNSTNIQIGGDLKIKESKRNGPKQ
ncbi:hypothetical protein FA459_10915 [Pseudomonas aeruginosa]|nr:hypothetical protein [Pseudomonas aeruginosa]MCO1769609.1 hypothetical protein [Pseudomonas aeruginosa]